MSAMKRSNGVLSGANAEFLEDLYQAYLQQPASVSAEWGRYFDALHVSHSARNGDGVLTVQNTTPFTEGERNESIALGTDKQAAVIQMIVHMRRLGHTHAQLDPLGRAHMKDAPDLSLGCYGLSDADLDTSFYTGNLFGNEQQTLREIYSKLQQTYCGSVGVEFLHIRQHERRNWLLERLEGDGNMPTVSDSTKGWVLGHLAHAEIFEKFLHIKFVGQKRFSLEGAESLIVMLNGMVNEAIETGVEDVVLGMPHRGRLNTLFNVMQKAPEQIFAEFDDTQEVNELTGSGDVKYHKGYSSDSVRNGKKVHLTLTFNPSHLEVVNPVALGNVRAKQDFRHDTQRKRIIPVIMHGDAAFAGQGLVMETMNLANLEGYTTGGTIHVIVNNQIGFTTLPHDSRSTVYASDACKMLNAPVFHVNGDDPEAVLRVSQLAVQYRQDFGADVYIDMYCYRRFGHNEGDEPGFTQPHMYHLIKNRPSTLQLYTEKLQSEGVVSPAQVKEIHDSYRQKLEDALSFERAGSAPKISTDLEGVWEGIERRNGDSVVPPISKEVLVKLSEVLWRLPKGFNLHPRLKRLIESRKKMALGESALDWGMGELLAYGSLVYEGLHVRISGQDSMRGTFSHRHAGFIDMQSAKPFYPLQHVKAEQGDFHVFNSPLSEMGVLGFEYGYSLASPQALVIWEAQFGDFANGAQVVIDQFICCAEHKWRRMSGLVLLLPHGFEGQGAEHSSARLERYLQLCAEDNIQVVYPTTPAQCFHMMRRQMHGRARKPLIVMSPKSLLRHPRATSPLSSFAQGEFQKVICDHAPDPANIKRVLLCSGKVYYDLLQKIEAENRQDAILMRVEQLYPFPSQEIVAGLNAFPNLQTVYWAQEEPQNMGGWTYVAPHLHKCLPKQIVGVQYVGRKAAAAVAVGSHRVHQHEQEQLLTDALA